MTEHFDLATLSDQNGLAPLLTYLTETPVEQRQVNGAGVSSIDTLTAQAILSAKARLIAPSDGVSRCLALIGLADHLCGDQSE